MMLHLYVRNNNKVKNLLNAYIGIYKHLICVCRDAFGYYFEKLRRCCRVNVHYRGILSEIHIHTISVKIIF